MLEFSISQDFEFRVRVISHEQDNTETGNKSDVYTGEGNKVLENTGNIKGNPVLSRLYSRCDRQGPGRNHGLPEITLGMPILNRDYKCSGSIQ